MSREPIYVSNQKGAVMVMALVLFVIITVLITALISLTYQEVSYSDHYSKEQEAQQAADAAVDWTYVVVDKCLENKYIQQDESPDVSGVFTDIGGGIGSNVSLNIEYIGQFDSDGYPINSAVEAWFYDKRFFRYRIKAEGESEDVWYESGQKVDKKVEVVISCLYTSYWKGLDKRWNYNGIDSTLSYIIR